MTIKETPNERRGLVIVCALLSGCLTAATRYSLQTFDLDGGSLVLFNCHVDQYSKTWHAEAESKARSLFVTELPKRTHPHDSIAILDISLSEGGWAGVFAAVGTKSFTEEWGGARGRLEAGRKASEMWAKNNGPSSVKKGRFFSWTNDPNSGLGSAPSTNESYPFPKWLE